MKKTGILTCAALLFVGFYFIIARGALAQSTAQLSPIQKSMLDRIKQVTGQDAVPNESVPNIILYEEPDFTVGFKNTVFWDQLDSVITVTQNGKTFSVLRSSCDIWLNVGFDTTASDIFFLLTGDENSFTVPNKSWTDQKQADLFAGPIYYSAVLYVPLPDTSFLISIAANVVSSRQDTTKPAADSFYAGIDSLGTPPQNGWFGKDSIFVNYVNLRDIAGIASAHLRGDITAPPVSFKDNPNGKKGPDSLNGHFELPDALSSGTYKVLLGATDAAYSADSHGKGATVDANWTLDGNRNDSIDSTVIKIDKDDPVIDISAIKDRYINIDVTNGTINCEISATDTHSGIDTIKVNENSDTLEIINWTFIGGDADGAGASATFDISGIPPDGIKTSLTLSISAYDRAGNEGTLEKQIEINIDPAYFTFCLKDTSGGLSQADSGYCNEEIVAWNTIEASFAEEDVENITFTPDGESAPLVVWRSGLPKLLDLNDIFPAGLKSGSTYTVNAAVTLKNGITSRQESLPSASIIFDNESPVFQTVIVKDVADSPLPAFEGFTDSSVVSFELSVSEHVDSLIIDGNVKPATIPFVESGELRLDTTGDETKQIVFTTKDHAGNWSNPVSKHIVYLPKAPTVFIQAERPHVVDEKNVPVTLAIKAENRFLQYCHEYFTQRDTVACNALEWTCEQQDDTCTALVEFFVSDSGYDTFALSDSAGNKSNIDTVYFDVQTPPVISAELYDFSEFDPENLEGSDGEYTDAMNDDKKIVAVVSKTDGSWTSVGYWFENQHPDSATWIDVDTMDSLVVITASLEGISFDDCYIAMNVQAKNKIGKISDSVQDSILHDTMPPKLTSLSADPDYDNKVINVSFGGEDATACSSGVAGIVLKDSALVNGETKLVYLAADQERNLTPVEQSGLHHLTAFLVDKADVVQSIPRLEGDLIPLGSIDQPSDTLSATFNWQPNTSLVYNYPNPFDPANDKFTSFHFALEKPGRVDLKIFDLFGNLVYERQNIDYNSLNDARDDSETHAMLTWNGKNGSGQIVASGTYIAIIKPENGKALKPIKVGVKRSN